jgi:hypothetical protein
MCRLTLKIDLAILKLVYILNPVAWTAPWPIHLHLRQCVVVALALGWPSSGASVYTIILNTKIILVMAPVKNSSTPYDSQRCVTDVRSAIIDDPIFVPVHR